jgi:membrane-bound lytic murein transglycosylase D
MMNKKSVLLLVLTLMWQGCSTINQGQSSHESKTDDKKTAQTNGNRIQHHLVETGISTCDDCIVGSSHQGTFASPLQVYELVGADHLNLKNTHFDIPVVWNKDVKKWVSYFTGRGREYFGRYAERGGRYAPVLSKILAENGLPRDLIYLAMAESGFQNHAKSWAKAVGPWQFMSFTGKKYGLDIDWYKDERRDPLKASAAAAGYLKDLYDLFGSWELATAGYNAGEGKIGRAIQRYGTRDFWKLTNGRYLKPETKNYVPKIMALAIIGKNLSSFGFNEISFDQPLDYEEIAVPPQADLYEIARILEVEFDEIKKFNPELIRWQTPALVDSYKLRIPVGAKEKWDQYSAKEEVTVDRYFKYTVQGFSSLDKVAQKYRLPTEVLKQLNPELAHAKIATNTEVKLPFRENHAPYHEMYSDLKEPSRRWFKSKRSYYRTIASVRGGKSIKNPKQFYVVKKGDTLWHISRKTGVPMETIIRSNSNLVNRRQVMPGDKLAIR